MTANVGARREGIDVDVLSMARLAAADVAVVTDAAQNMIFVSESFTAMTGYAAEQALGENWRLLQGPGSNPDTVDEIRQVLAAGEIFEGELLNYRRDGSAFWNSMRIIPLRQQGDQVTHFVSVHRDISNRIALLEQLKFQALHDQMTGLPNRAAGERAVEDAVVRSLDAHTTVGVGLIDLDDFRIINNELGHAAGDTVLCQWASRLQSRLRDSDLLARMGGDEFLLIVKHIDRAHAQSDLAGILDRIHQAVDEPFTVAGQDVHVDMSMGIALVPEDGADSRTILRHADEALYAVKARGRRRTLWWQAARTGSSAEAEPRKPTPRASVPALSSPADAENRGGRRPTHEEGASSALNIHQEAVAHGDVVIELQPVIDLGDGSVHLFEALARLRPPGCGLIYPNDFLPHLVNADQRVLFERVLGKALDFLIASDEAGKNFDVSVNLPPTILNDAATLRTVEEALSSRGLQPRRLGLELLESDILGSDVQRSALQDLVNLGVGLAMDDLGSGYSTLQRLASFPFSALKLDRGLLANTYQKPLDTLSMMATLIQMGRDLAMNLVIEGLEDENLTEAAVVFGAPLGQGYYLAKPMPVSEAISWDDDFSFTFHRSPLRTPLGALAYHWQFARLGTAHPLELARCPLTRFLGDQNCSEDVHTWHERQHTPQGIHPASSRFLIDWLTHQVRASHPDPQ